MTHYPTWTNREVVFYGTVRDIDKGARSFQLQLIQGDRVQTYASKEILDEVDRALKEGGDNARLLFKGVGVYRHNELEYLMQVDSVSLIAPLDIAAQLDRLRNLKDGWADGMQHPRDWGKGYGKAPSHEGLDWLGDTLEREYPDDLPLPRIYPTPEGGVQMEWTLGGFVAVLEVNLDGREGEWLWFDIASEDEDEESLNLDDSDSWSWLAAEIRRLEASSV